MPIKLLEESGETSPDSHPELGGEERKRHSGGVAYRNRSWLKKVNDCLHVGKCSCIKI